MQRWPRADRARNGQRYRGASVLGESERRLYRFISTRFPCANRFPPRIKSGASSRAKTLQLDLQPLAADGGICRELRRGTVKNDPAMTHDVKPRADLQCDCEFLLDQENGNPAPGDLRQEFADLLDQFGRKTFG